MHLHQRGVDLLLNVLDAADQVEQLTHDDMRRLLAEIAEVMSLILERDALSALKRPMQMQSPRIRAPDARAALGCRRALEDAWCRCYAPAVSEPSPGVPVLP